MIARLLELSLADLSRSSDCKGTPHSLNPNNAMAKLDEYCWNLRPCCHCAFTSSHTWMFSGQKWMDPWWTYQWVHFTPIYPHLEVGYVITHIDPMDPSISVLGNVTMRLSERQGTSWLLSFLGDFDRSSGPCACDIPAKSAGSSRWHSLRTKTRVRPFGCIEFTHNTL